MKIHYDYNVPLEENLSIATICCDWAIATHGMKMYENNQLWLSIAGYDLPKNRNQKPPVNNQSDLFMHFLVISRNAKSQWNSGNGQVFF